MYGNDKQPIIHNNSDEWVREIQDHEKRCSINTQKATIIFRQHDSKYA